MLIKDDFKTYKEPMNPLFDSPKSIQQTLEIQSIAANGVFQITKHYFSVCYEFKDINYVIATQEGQIAIMEEYGKFLNSLDYAFKIVVVNQPKDIAELRKNVLIKPVGDSDDKMRELFNEHIEAKIDEGRKGVEQTKYLVVTIKADDFSEANRLFDIIEGSITAEFGSMGSEIYRLDASARCNAIRKIYQIGKTHAKDINYADYVEHHRDVRNDIVNTEHTKYEAERFELDDKVCCTLYAQQYPNSVSDQFFNELTSLPMYSVTSLDINPIPKDIAIKKINDVYIGVENKIIKQQEKRNKNQNYSTDISYSVLQEKTQIKEQLDGVRLNDQKVFYAGLNMTIIASDRKELNDNIRSVKTLGRTNQIKIAEQRSLQRMAFNTTLPIGTRQVSNLRTMETGDLAAFMPFHVQELNYAFPNTYYGVNQVSKNVLLGNRKKLMNGNGFFFGVSGSGKSFKGKEEMEAVYLGTNDDIIIVDPQNEYVHDIAELFHGAAIELSNKATKYVNPLEIALNLLDTSDKDGLIRDKAEFMLGICEQCLDGSVITPVQKTLIDDACNIMYNNIAAKPLAARVQPTFTDFYNILEEMEKTDYEIKDIRVGIKRFVSGSMNLFNHPTNIDTSNRLTVYGIKDLGAKMRPLAMLIMLETIRNKIMDNYEKGKSTWVYIDEIHVLMNDPFTVGYLYNLWKIVRKFNCLMSGITQNVVDLSRNDISRTMIANSEFIVLLKQSANDIDIILDNVEGLTAELLQRYVANAPSGTGIIKHGNTVLPFDSRIDTDSILYWINNTNPHEQDERRRRLGLSA